MTSMDTVKDFEDLLDLFENHGVRYLIIGGLAFIYHAKPRYTKDMDLWVDFTPDNLKKANEALTEFGSSGLLNLEKDDEVLQLGFAPNRIDLFLRIVGIRFADAWRTRIRVPSSGCSGPAIRCLQIGSDSATNIDHGRTDRR